MEVYINGYKAGKWYGVVSLYHKDEPQTKHKFQVNASSYREAEYQALLHAINQVATGGWPTTFYSSDKYMIEEIKGQVAPAFNHRPTVQRIRELLNEHPDWRIEWQHWDYLRKHLPKIPYQSWLR